MCDNPAADMLRTKLRTEMLSVVETFSAARPPLVAFLAFSIFRCYVQHSWIVNDRTTGRQHMNALCGSESK